MEIAIQDRGIEDWLVLSWSAPQATWVEAQSRLNYLLDQVHSEAELASPELNDRVQETDGPWTPMAPLFYSRCARVSALAQEIERLCRVIRLFELWDYRHLSLEG